MRRRGTHTIVFHRRPGSSRREFLASMGTGAAAVAGMAVTSSLLAAPEGGPALVAQQKASPTNAGKNWAWLRANFDSMDAWQRMLATIRGAGIHAVLYTATPEFFRAHVAAAKTEGVELHAWFPTMMRGENVGAHPDWYAVSREGASAAVKPPYVDYYKFMCPSRDDVRAYLTGLVRELAHVDGLAGVHLDYIRYPDVILPVALWPKYHIVQDKEYPPYDFCYCEVCASRFARESGRDPRHVADPTTDQAWRQFRYDRITDVVTALASETHAAGKMITAAVFPTPTIARALVRQDWTKWPLDAVLPMTYHGFYNEKISWIETAAREGVTALAGRRPLYSGLYVPDLPPDDLAHAVAFAQAGGANGISIFEASGLTPAHWTALRGALARGASRQAARA